MRRITWERGQWYDERGRIAPEQAREIILGAGPGARGVEIEIRAIDRVSGLPIRPIGVYGGWLSQWAVETLERGGLLPQT